MTIPQCIVSIVFCTISLLPVTSHANTEDKHIPNICLEAQKRDNPKHRVELWTGCLEANIDEQTKGIALYNRALAFMQLDKAQAAINDYSKACQYLQTDPDVYINRGYAYLQLKKFPEAHSDFSRAIAFNPDSFEAYTNRAAVNIQTGNDTEAVYDLETALEKNPEYLPALYGLGTLFAMHENYNKRNGKRALDIAFQLMELQYDSQTLSIFAAALAELKDFPNAIKAQEEAIELAQKEGKPTKRLKDDLCSYRRGEPCH